MVGDLFDNLKAGLAKPTLDKPEGIQAAFNWFPAYKESAPTAPVGPADGIYQVSPAENANLAMQISDNADGTRIGLSRWTGATGQESRLHTLGNNTYWLEPQSAVGKCVDVANNKTNDDAALNLRGYSGALNQQWIVIGLGNNQYRLAPVMRQSYIVGLA